MRVAVIGVGGVGSAAARFLAAAGHEVTVLEQFQSYVADHEVRYFVVSNRDGPHHGNSGPAQEITTWVQQNFTAIDVGGTTVYDLSQQR